MKATSFPWTYAGSERTGMTIELRPETEARLLEVSRIQGRDPADVIEDALSAALPWAVADNAEEARLLLQRLKEMESGNERPASDFFREHRQRYPEPRE